MRLKNSKIIIPSDGHDPFVNCKLDRKKYAEILTSIVENYKDGFVLAIDNKWGTGKTTFIQMWRQYLINKEFNTLYFNAWENDFQEDVIIALLSELEEFKYKEERTFKKLVEKSATFLKRVFPAIVKGVANKAIGEQGVSEVAEAMTEFTSEEVENQMKYFNEKKHGIKEFRKILEEFVDYVDQSKPLIFIIDELDRCRPKYSVEILEQIKHLFNVPGIVFVLSIDKIQLGNAVRGFYGSDMIDADEYLRRFIDLEYRIPEPNPELFISYLYDFFEFGSFLNLSERQNVRDFQEDRNRFIQYSLVLYSKGFSLRQIEKAFARIRLTLRFFSIKQYVFPEIIVIVSFLDLKHSSTLYKIRKFEYSLQGLVDELDKIFLPLINERNNRRVRFMFGSFLCRYENFHLDKYGQLKNGLVEKDESNNSKLSITSRLENDNGELLHAIEYYKRHFYTDNISLDYILKKYDLTEFINN